MRACRASVRAPRDPAKRHAEIRRNATGNIRGICSSRVLKEWRNTELQRPQRTDQPILGSQLVIVPYRQKYTYTLEVERATPLRPAVPPRPGNSYLREKKTP